MANLRPGKNLNRIMAGEAMIISRSQLGKSLRQRSKTMAMINQPIIKDTRTVAAGTTTTIKAVAAVETGKRSREEVVTDRTSIRTKADTATTTIAKDSGKNNIEIN